MTCLPPAVSCPLASTRVHKLIQANTNSHIYRGAPTRSRDTWLNVWAFWHTLTGALWGHSALTKRQHASGTSQSPHAHM